MGRKEEDLRALRKSAMLAKREEVNVETKSRYITFKNIFDEAQKRAKEQKLEELPDAMIISAAKKEIKQLNETLVYCNDNLDKKEEIEFSLKAANELLPKMATEQKIKDFVEKNKTEANNIGAMMKLLKSEFGDSLDGKLASQIVKSVL